ncbi:3-hydroxyacyl-CoA dehydratase 1 isoform X2 [Lycorma delicatula]|uniref:3-hydroxyacyl-CoA dehydratase 1 isoform X2 n=1 Tax=Lycorma delicatula TaxID=130591 RepID=UPI003F5172A0
MKETSGNNSFLFFSYYTGWSYLLYQVISHYLSGKGTDTIWEVVKPTVVVFQNAAVFEIFNVAAGLVKSNLMLTTFQVFSRVMVVCGVLLATPTAPVSFGMPLLLFAWSITEIIRYGYYALNIINLVPYVLVWCRYTFFFALYPIGVSGELLCFYAAQQFVGDTKLWTYELPNSLNFTFNYRYLLIYIMSSYIPLFPMLYLHMVSQRKKIIGGGSTKPTDKKKS